MDLSGLSSVTNKDQLTAWLTDNLVTPVSPAISASDLGAILEKTATVLGTGDGGISEADNGLSIVQLGSGATAKNTIELGGELRADTTISLGGHRLILSGTQNNTTSLVLSDQAGDPIIVLSVTDTTDLKSALTMAAGLTKLQLKDRAIVFDDIRMAIADDTLGKGLENAGDFEANFTARSLVTKQYVDSSGALKAPLQSPVFTGSPGIIQANQPTVTTGSGASASAAFTVHGGAGGATSSSGSLAAGGNGSEVNISSGNGGGSTGAAGTAIGGNGGDIILAAGIGGSVTGQHTNGFPGTGGSVHISAGGGGTHVNTSGPGGSVYVSGGSGGTGNGQGGNIYFVPGRGTGSGTPGTVFLAVNDGVTQQGNVVIGSGIDDYTHVLQVTGPAIFSSLTAKINRRVLTLSANSATPAVNTDDYDVVHITAQTAAITGFTLTGTPVDGDTLRISITGTVSVPFTLGGSFEPSGGVALSTTTQGTQRLDMGFVWNTETSKWRQIAVA